MIADAGVERLVRARKLAARLEPQQVLAHVHRVGGDQLGVEVFGQLDVFLPQHERGRGLGADDRVTVAHGVGEHAQVRERRFARVIDVADDQGGHSRAALAGRHEDVDLGVVQHADDRLGQLLIVVVGVDVDEIDDARPGQLGPRLVEAPPRRPAHERGAPHPGQEPVPRDAEQPVQQAARRCAATAGSW